MRTYTIAEVCERFSSGKSIKASQIFENGDYPVFGGNGERGFTDTYNFEGECAIIGRQGAYCGNTRYFSGKAYMTEHAIVATTNENHNVGYVANLLSMMNLGQYQGQSAQPGLSVATLSKVEMRLPKKEVQDKIFQLLSTLDEKIALNNQINATLEQMAKTLYDYWFVQFDFPDDNGKPYKTSGGEMVYNETLKREIPKGWDVKILDDVMRIFRGASPRPIDDFIQDFGIPWIKISDATSANTPFIFETKQFIKESGKNYSRYLKPNTLILSNSASPGIPKIVEINCCVHDGWLIVDDFKENIFNEFMYFYFLNFKDKIENMGSGSVFKNLKTDYIKELDIVLPSERILQMSKIILESTFEKLKTSENENLKLTQLRDWLLPMLMNGQVTITGE